MDEESDETFCDSMEEDKLCSDSQNSPSILGGLQNAVSRKTSQLLSCNDDGGINSVPAVHGSPQYLPPAAKLKKLDVPLLKLHQDTKPEEMVEPESQLAQDGTPELPHPPGKFKHLSYPPYIELPLSADRHYIDVAESQQTQDVIIGGAPDYPLSFVKLAKLDAHQLPEGPDMGWNDSQLTQDVVIDDGSHMKKDDSAIKARQHQIADIKSKIQNLSRMKTSGKDIKTSSEFASIKNDMSTLRTALSEMNIEQQKSRERLTQECQEKEWQETSKEKLHMLATKQKQILELFRKYKGLVTLLKGLTNQVPSALPGISEPLDAMITEKSEALTSLESTSEDNAAKPKPELTESKCSAVTFSVKEPGSTETRSLSGSCSSRSVTHEHRTINQSLPSKLPAPATIIYVNDTSTQGVSTVQGLVQSQPRCQATLNPVRKLSVSATSAQKKNTSGKSDEACTTINCTTRVMTGIKSHITSTYPTKAQPSREGLSQSTTPLSLHTFALQQASTNLRDCTLENSFHPGSNIETNTPIRALLLPFKPQTTMTNFVKKGILVNKSGHLSGSNTVSDTHAKTVPSTSVLQGSTDVSATKRTPEASYHCGPNVSTDSQTRTMLATTVPRVITYVLTNEHTPAKSDLLESDTATNNQARAELRSTFPQRSTTNVVAEDNSLAVKISECGSNSATNTRTKSVSRAPNGQRPAGHPNEVVPSEQKMGIQSTGTSAGTTPRTPSLTRNQTGGAPSLTRKQTGGAASLTRKQTGGAASMTRKKTGGAASMTKKQTGGRQPEKGATKGVVYNQTAQTPRPDLKSLLQHGVLQPGINVLSVQIQGKRFEASLMANGQIQSDNGDIYTTPMSWIKGITGSRTHMSQARSYDQVCIGGKVLSSYLPPKVQQANQKSQRANQNSQRDENLLRNCEDLVNLLRKCQVRLVQNDELLPTDIFLPSNFWETDFQQVDIDTLKATFG